MVSQAAESGRRCVSTLLDNSIYKLTQTVEAAPQKVRGVDGGDRPTGVVGVQRKRPYSGSEKWKQTQIESLPVIMRLAREGRVRLCTYGELGLEKFGGKIGLRGITGDLLKGIQLEHVQAPIRRGMFHRTELFEFAKKERVTDFCKLLLTLRYEMFTSYPEILASFTEFELRNLQALERFRELCRDVSTKHYPDVLHLWTAETNGLDYFLTTDRKFINAMTQSSRALLTTRAIAPRDLLKQLGVDTIDPLPINDDKWHPLYEVC